MSCPMLYLDRWCTMTFFISLLTHTYVTYCCTGVIKEELQLELQLQLLSAFDLTLFRL